MRHLKIYALLTLLTLTFTLPACNKDDDKAEPTAEEMIVGKWFLTNVDTGVPSEALSDCERKTFFEFKSAGNFYAEAHTLDGGDCKIGSLEGSYSITTNGKYIILNMGGSTTIQFEIKKLTTSLFVYSPTTVETTYYLEKKE